ncbi:MAG TPA: MarR family transcriptional regulator [Desulfobacterales bacterium]
MRPIASEQDPLRYPLNDILGTRAQVRLLRVMATEVEGPLTVADIAERSGLTVPGAQKALDKLLRSGFVSRVGGGRKHQYEIRRSDQLMQMTIALFQEEKSRYEQLFAALKKKIDRLSPPPQAVWIQAVPREIDEPLMLGMFHESLYLNKCMRELRPELAQIEKGFDLAIELEGFTKADIPDLELDGVNVIYGILPKTSNEDAQKQAKKALTHGEKNRLLKILSQSLAKSIEKDPSLIKRAKDHIDRLLQEDQGTATEDIMEWRNILDSYSDQRLARFLTSSSERANRLRQSNPFFAVLNTAERARMTEALENRSDAQST